MLVVTMDGGGIHRVGVLIFSKSLKIIVKKIVQFVQLAWFSHYMKDFRMFPKAKRHSNQIVNNLKLP